MAHATLPHPTNGSAPTRPANHPAHERAVVALRFAQAALRQLLRDPNVSRKVRADARAICWALKWQVAVLDGELLPR